MSFKTTAGLLLGLGCVLHALAPHEPLVPPPPPEQCTCGGYFLLKPGTDVVKCDRCGKRKTRS